MATQQTIIAETIRGMKAALRRTAYDSDSDTPAAYHTNRGNKLKRSARFVHEGRLDTTGGQSYRKRVHHAGYMRNVLHDNPMKFDEDGDPLDDFDEDDDASASGNEENPFENTKLEELLMPLTSAAELSNHPSLATAYTSKNLTDMADKARDIVHREQALLVKLKAMLQRFRGDCLWVPAGDVESVQDSFLLDSDDEDLQSQVDQRTEVSELDRPTDTQNNTSDVPAADATFVENGIQSVDMAMKVPIEDGTTAISENGAGSEVNDERKDTIEPMDIDEPGTATMNGTGADDDEDGPNHAMTTRAKARTPPTGDGSPLSSAGSPTSFSVASINPFFIPASMSLPDRDFGLPANEAEDTRRMLLLFVQKQEETVRGVERLMLRLLEANRKRKEVWRWCKAEKHVGELSDGEDWYDKEEWGLTADLVKGKEEEDIEEDSARKGRRRRDARKPGPA